MTPIDVDAYRKTEAALRDRERDLLQLIDMVPSHLWRLTPEGEPTFFNKRMVDFLGMEAADVDRPGMSRLEALIVNVVHPEDVAEFRDVIRHSLGSGANFALRYRVRRADGVYRWMLSRAEPMRDETGRIVHWHGFSQDIDDQVQVEDALRRRERELQQFIDTVPVQVWSTTATGQPGYMNKTMLDYMGMQLHDYDVGQGMPNVLRTFHPEDQPRMLAALLHSFTTGEPFDMVFRNRRADGEYRWMHGRGNPLRDNAGKIIQWYGANVDIHDMLMSQEALQDSQRQLEQLIDAVPVNLLSYNPSGKLTYASKRLLEQIGMPMERIEHFDTLGRELTHPDDLPEMFRTSAAAFATGQPYVIRFRRRDKHGVYRWVESRAQALRDSNGGIVQWYIASIDVDDEMRAQQALREQTREREQVQAQVEQLRADFAHAARVSMLGELTASIAHEVNQPLTAIAASSQASLNWLARPTPDIDRVRKLTQDVVSDTQRASDIISRIRAMAAGRAPEQALLSLDDIIRETLLFLRHEVEARKVAVSHVPAPGFQKVLGDRTQLQQVIVNLTINAVQALTNAGSGKRAISIRTNPDGADALRCSIEDSGSGIDPENIARLFDSFFTTKESGMGMGLRICRSVIEAHGGRIAVDNESSLGGARFQFTLPVALESA